LSEATEMRFQQQRTYCFAWLVYFLMYNITFSPFLCPTRFLQAKETRASVITPPFHTTSIRTTDKGISL